MKGFSRVHENQASLLHRCYICRAQNPPTHVFTSLVFFMFRVFVFDFVPAILTFIFTRQTFFFLSFFFCFWIIKRIQIVLTKGHKFAKNKNQVYNNKIFYIIQMNVFLENKILSQYPVDSICVIWVLQKMLPDKIEQPKNSFE